MDETQALLSSQELAILRLLEFLYDHGGRDSPIDLREAPWPSEDSPSLVRSGDESGYITTYRNAMSLADSHPPALLNNFGIRYVEEVREARADAVKRARACRNSLLRWIYDIGGEFVDPRGMLVADPPRLYFGEPFTESDVNAASKHLVDAGFMRADSTQANGATVIATLTARGSHCVEDFDGNVRAYMNRHDTPPVAFTQNFNGPFSGQAAQGQSVEQSQVQNGVPAESLAPIFDRLLQATREVPNADDRADLEEAIASLRQAVSVDEPDTAEVERRANFLRRQADRMGATALTTIAASSTTELLNLLGGSVF